MSILVLGGAGYIGSHTVRALCDQGYDTIVADSLVTGYLAAVDNRARFYRGDISDFGFLDSLFKSERIDSVIHFAAFIEVGESMSDPLKYYQNNLCGTHTLLKAMVANGVGRIVFSSTAAVYGEPESVPITEAAPTRPGNAYGETKLSMERLFYWTAQAHGLRYVSLRYFNACGADASGEIGEAHSPESHLVPLILQVPNGKRPHISVFGDDYPTPDGSCVRDYIHVSDLADAHVLAIKYLEAGGASETMNLGNGIGFSVWEVINTARAVTGHPIPAVVTPRRAGDPARLVASSDKAKKLLGWQPRHDSLEEIIASAWNWHKNHPNGYNG